MQSGKIVVENLYKVFGAEPQEAIDLLKQGWSKSTLIRLINRLVEPSGGNVYIDGQNVAKMPKAELIDLRRRDMSMVFQSFALMPSRSVLDNAAFGLEVAGKSKKVREERAMQVLKQV